jgi:hypothetical protein
MERGNEAHSIGRPNLSRIARHRPDLPIVRVLRWRSDFAPPRQPVGGGLHTQTDLVVGQGGDVWVMNNWQDIDSCFGVPDEVLSTRCAFGIAKLETQTLSLPSMVAALGPGRPPPLNGEPGYSLPSGFNRVTLPSPPRCFAIARVKTSSGLPPRSALTSISATSSPPRIELPSRFVTQTLPWLSMQSVGLQNAPILSSQSRT